MKRGECVCGKLGYTKCTVHGDPIKGVGLTDEEFTVLVARNRGAVLELFQIPDSVLPTKKIGRPRGKRGAR